MGPLACDFIVLAQPRSGTHMLGFALDSHPEINFLGEYGFYRHKEKWSGKGRLKGCVCPSYSIHNVETDTAIVLTRDQDLRWQEKRPYIKHTSLHYFDPAKLETDDYSRFDINLEKQRQTELLEAAEKYDKRLTISYEYLRDNCDGLDFSAVLSAMLCKFLCVDNRRLKTQTYRPIITNNAESERVICG